MNSEQFRQEAETIEKALRSLRVEERDAVIPFMDGGFTQWDLYLASSSEYVMRLIDGFIPMLETRNFVCVAQLLRAQVGVCLRTLALFVAKDQEDYLKQVFRGVPVNRLKDRSGKNMTDGRLQDLLSEFDPEVENVYKATSGFVHFSTDILPSMGVPGEGCEVEFNFGAVPNERNNASLVGCGKAFCHYIELHLKILHRVIASDEWYADRCHIDCDSPVDKGTASGDA
ncbi:hypothetical protein [Collinsella sp.]|uniref:hypothetical protein n=1 Tax=Collinsella sp. TaxID=1965294 RepID=UPI003FEE13BE